ncbi:hypothetical protein [Pseudonocardia endophytica]|uniref:hypothetical protein n=1 Tax=Pseudonocardia endophytica TaxID=401976 RepID=UPI0010476C5C|nr:hypothetical protein [Pseudonocardia endophytica]
MSVLVISGDVTAEAAAHPTGPPDPRHPPETQARCPTMDAKKIWPDGWQSPRPYIRIVSQPQNS